MQVKLIGELPKNVISIQLRFLLDTSDNYWHLYKHLSSSVIRSRANGNTPKFISRTAWWAVTCHPLFISHSTLSRCKARMPGFVWSPTLSCIIFTNRDNASAHVASTGDVFLVSKGWTTLEAFKYVPRHALGRNI